MRLTVLERGVNLPHKSDDELIPRWKPGADYLWEVKILAPYIVDDSPSERDESDRKGQLQRIHYVTKRTHTEPVQERGCGTDEDEVDYGPFSFCVQTLFPLRPEDYEHSPKQVDR